MCVFKWEKTGWKLYLLSRKHSKYRLSEGRMIQWDTFKVEQCGRSKESTSDYRSDKKKKKTGFQVL